MSNASPSPTSSRSGLNTWLFLAALAAVLFLLVWFRPMESLLRSSATSHAAVGQRVPSASLLSLTAAAPVDPAELKGNVVLLNFWGTWCPPCRQELPHLVDLKKRFANEDFRFLAVSCGGDKQEDLSELTIATNDYLSQVALSVPAYADPEGLLRSELGKLGAFNDGYPTTLVLDRGGVIRGVWEGYSPGVEQQMERLIASLIAENSASRK